MVKISYTYTLDEDAIRRYCEARRWDEERIHELLENEDALLAEFEEADFFEIERLGSLDTDVEVI